MDRHIVVYDSFSENCIMGVFKLPKGMDFDEACSRVELAQEEAGCSEENKQLEEILEEQGFDSLNFSTYDVNEEPSVDSDEFEFEE